MWKKRSVQAWGKLLFCPLMFPTISKSSHIPCPWQFCFFVLAATTLRPTANGHWLCAFSSWRNRRSDLHIRVSSSGLWAWILQICGSLTADADEWFGLMLLISQADRGRRGRMDLSDKPWLSVGTEKPTLEMPNFIIPLVSTSYDDLRMQDWVWNSFGPLMGALKVIATGEKRV